MYKREKDVRVNSYRTRSGKRVNPFRRRQKVGKKPEENTKNLAIVGGASAVVLAAVGLNSKYKVTNKAVLSAASTAYKSASEGTISSLVNKASTSSLLNEKQKQDLLKMSGAGKVFLAKTILDKKGFKLQGIDSKNNFSTWSSPQGSILSVGSVANSVLTFESKRGRVLKGNFPEIEMAFKVNESYNKNQVLSPEEGLKIARQAKAMYSTQLSLIPENALLRAEPWKADGLGTKRKSIYEKYGFRELPGMNSKYIYAVKNQGSFSTIQDNQVDRIKEIMEYKREEKSINFKKNKRVSQEARRKIGLGVKSFYDKKGRKSKNNKKKFIISALLGTGAIGLTTKALLKRKSVPVIMETLPISKTLELGKVSKTVNQARKTFKDSLGKFYRKGSFLPSGGKGKAVSDIGLVKRGRDFTTGMKTGTINQSTNSKGTRPDSDYFNNNWIK